MISKNSRLALYKSFVDAFMKGHPGVTRCACHFNAQIEWNKIKHDQQLIKRHIDQYLQTPSKITEDQPVVINQTQSVESTTQLRKRALSSDDEFEPYNSDLDDGEVTPVEPTFFKRDSSLATDFNDEDKPWVRRSLERARARAEARRARLAARRHASDIRTKTPVQEAVIQRINDISERIDSLVQVKNMGLSTTESSLTLKKLLKQKKECTNELRRLKSKQIAATRYRIRKKLCVESICAADPEVASQLCRFYEPTTLRVQIDNICPALLKTLEDIARLGGAIDSNARLINMPLCASLDELRDRVKARSFEIRRSSTFYRIFPVGTFREDGKRHVVSGSVQLRKIKGIGQKRHEDSHFVTAIAQHIKDLASTFGNDCVFYMIEDRKASIRLGRPSDLEHSPLIMHLDYQISSVDSLPVPPSLPHQLKPVVYASCVIDDVGHVGFAGPTYVSLRSTRHHRFTVDDEDLDFERVVKLREFEKTARNHIGVIKPILIMAVDTLDPTDYTRFPKTLMSAINRFKKYNFDALFLVTQASGQTMFNVAERRLAILSQDLSGLVLPHDYFGTHLNLSGYAVDADLEKSNVKKAGEVLAEVWTMDRIDGQPVLAEFIDPPISVDRMLRFIDTRTTVDELVDEVCDEEEEIPLGQRIKYTRPVLHPEPEEDTKPKPIYPIDEYWCATHVFQTQYTIQIIRCTKPECCGQWRSNYIQVFPHRFLPPPVPFHRSSGGVRLAELETSTADRHPNSPYYGTLFQRIQFHGIVMRRTQSALLPFDAFCPSIQNKLHYRTCSICKQYVPSPMRLRNHYRVHQQRSAPNRMDSNVTMKKEEESTDELDPVDPSDLSAHQISLSEPGVHLFSNMAEWLRSDFEELPVVESKHQSSASLANAKIRQEKQMALADSNVSELTTDGPMPEVPSVATISLDEALSTSALDGLSLAEIKTESVLPNIADIKIEKECILDSIEEAVALDERKNGTDDLLAEYDVLQDLIDQI